MEVNIINFADKTFTSPAQIRNFCIIAHIDHGKSTLADRMLQLTGVVDDRIMRTQYLDRMDIERERGITIKAQNVRLPWKIREKNGSIKNFVLNLIDTPGHIDFNYEVSRALSACEGALLLIDASQGIEAQTLTNLYLALELNATIIPVLNKIDLSSSETVRYANEISKILGCKASDVILVSGKTGEGVPKLLDEVVKRIKAPCGNIEGPTRAIIFDSIYDLYRGVITYVRVIDGEINSHEQIMMMSNETTHELLEIGIVSPEPKISEGLGTGEVGYLITGLKDIRQSIVGDTITTASNSAKKVLTRCCVPKPMVYAGIFPTERVNYLALRDALYKLKLNDASLVYDAEVSTALGFGFRCGFLGLLHMEITRERLEREFNIDLISTLPNVIYRLVLDNKSEITVTNPSNWPYSKVKEIYEPIVLVTIITSGEFIGLIIDLCQSRRGLLQNISYLMSNRVELKYVMPLSEIIFDFFDLLKSRTRGYASLDYELSGEQRVDLIKVDILLQGKVVDAFSAILHKDSAISYGVNMTNKLKELIPRQNFEIIIQASVKSKIIARQTIKAIRKDVLSKCYGGDITRKRKLLEKQKKGKKRMKTIGNIEIPQEIFFSIMNTDINKKF